jgi:hypothetical protein
MTKHNSSLALFLAFALPFFMANCKSPQQALVGPQTNGQGIALLKITAQANSPFKLIARSAILTISAGDMQTMTSSLTVTDSSVEGKVVGIPSGNNRLFKVDIFDSATTKRYGGSALANVFGDSTVLVYISVYRIDGNAIINGSIHENGPSSPIIPAPDSGLMAYYPFNGNAADESDHGLNGQVYGATLTTDRFGEANRAYYFDGSSSGISAQVTSAFSLSKFTLTAWVKATGPGDYLPRIVAVGAAGTSTNYYSLCYDYGVWDHAPVTSEKLIFFNGNTFNPFVYDLQYSHGTVETQVWHHSAVSYDNGRLRFYIDGKLDKDTVILAPVQQFSGAAVLQIGYSEGGDRFNGSIDEVRVYNRALIDAEINALYSYGQ